MIIRYRGSFVEESNVYIVTGDDEKPVLVPREYSNFYPVEEK